LICWDYVKMRVGFPRPRFGIRKKHSVAVSGHGPTHVTSLQGAVEFSASHLFNRLSLP